MATPPRWADQNSNIIPIESVSAMTRMRVQEAVQFAAETEKEAGAAREHAAKLTAIADAAGEQRDYWVKVGEIANQIDLRLAADEDKVGVSAGTMVVPPPPAPQEAEPPF